MSKEVTQHTAEGKPDQAPQVRVVVLILVVKCLVMFSLSGFHLYDSYLSIDSSFLELSTTGIRQWCH